MSMKLMSKASGQGKVTVVFDDQFLRLRDDSRLAIGAKLAVLFGYPGNTYGDGPVVFEIKTKKGFRTLTVEGPPSEASTLLRRQRVRTWEDTTEWEVADEIARSLGFSNNDQRSIDPGDNEEIRRGISQTGETDWAFLRRIGERVDCVCYVADGIFHFHPPQLGDAPIKTLTYFDSVEGQFIGDPEIEIKPLGRAARATSSGVSTQEREVVTGTAGDTDDMTRPVCGSELLTAPPTSWEDELGLSPTERRQIDEVAGQELITPTSSTTEEEARRTSRRAFRGSERENVELSATLVGDPEIKADVTVRMAGLGPSLSGNYLITEAEHKIADGYETAIKAKRNALGQGSTSAPRRRQERNATSADLADHDSYEQTAYPAEWENALGIDASGQINDCEPRGRQPAYIADTESGEETVE